MNKEKFKEWIWNNILTILTILFPIFTYVLSAIRKYNGNQLTVLEWIFIAILTLEMLMIIVNIVWNKSSYRSYYYPNSKIRSNYDVINKSLYYQVNDNNELTFFRSMTIKSNIDNLQMIYDKFIWTGTGIANIPTPGLHIQEIKESNRIGIWKYFQIIFDSPISKGEELEIRYEWPVISNCNTSSPFFSTSTEEPTKEIKMILKLGRKYSEREIILEEYRAIEGDNPISKKRVNLDQCGDYIWTIDKPKRFRYYRIRWEWSLETQGIPEIGNLEEEK